MKELENIVKQLSNITEAYQYVEDNIAVLESKHDVTDFWVAYRNKTDDVGEKQMAQWELELFLFHIVGDRVFSFSYSTGEKPGDVFEYPVLDEHQTKAFEYLKRRAIEAKSYYLKARFNHLLWKAVKGVKNKKYGELSIEGYLKILSLFASSSAIADEDNNQVLIRKSECLAAIVAELKYRTDETVHIFRDLLLNIQNLKFYIKHSVLEIMLKYPVLFKRKDFESLLTVFSYDSELSKLQKTDDFMLAKSYLPTAVKIAAKLGVSIKEWESKIGECYARMGDAETDPERNWLKLQDYALAIQHFRVAGDTLRRHEIEEKYAILKEEVTLPTSVIEYDAEHIAHLKELEEEIKGKTAQLLTLPSDTIYEIIGKGAFFPTNQFITNSTKKITEPGWMQGITTVKFDINKNIESISADNDELEGWMFQYKYYIRHSVSLYLYHTLVPGIRSGVLTSKNFIKFLAEHTWLGATLTKKDLGGELVSYNWISLVAPSIHEYFVQMQASLSSELYKPNFILATDSLVTKFEGLFREFCIRIKTPTSTSHKGSMQEMYINQLLSHPTVIQCFSDEDRTFFEFLFTRENGLNLRNNIAHCYFDYTDYGYSYFHLLLAALLRLAKYQFKIESKAVQQKEETGTSV